MKLIVDENSKNYTCSIVEIGETFSIENSDNLNRVVVNGNNVVVPKSISKGDRMLYFCSGTKLSSDFCYHNNLYSDATDNKDKSVSGYISKNCRVKCLKLRGVISDGMLMTLDSLFYFLNDVSWLKVGDEFTHVDNTLICEKYVVPVKNSNPNQQKAEKKNKLEGVIVDNQFRFHKETEHFVKYQNKFTQETQIVITRKIHGSSLILSNILINKKLSFIDKLLLRLGIKIAKEEFGFVWSSGKPKSKLPKGVESTTNKWDTPNISYYTSDIWARAYKEIGHCVEKGISIYAEIVGEGIQGAQFTYGQSYGIHVYRITRTTSEGNVDEFSWSAVKNYCEKYGLNHVQEYFSGKVKELVVLDENLLEYLQQKYLNKSYPDCKIDEGVCVRIVETDEIFKLKSPNFILHESSNQENGIEEVES